MGIKKFAVEPTSVIHLKDANDNLMYNDEPDAEGKVGTTLPCRITVYGPGSKQHAKAVTRRNNALTDRLRGKGKTKQTADESIEENAQFLSDVTKLFENIVVDDKSDLIGEALFKEVYSDVSLGFIATQVNAEIGDWANFSKASATN